MREVSPKRVDVDRRAVEWHAAYELEGSGGTGREFSKEIL